MVQTEASLKAKYGRPPISLFFSSHHNSLSETGRRDDEPSDARSKEYSRILVSVEGVPASFGTVSQCSIRGC